MLNLLEILSEFVLSVIKDWGYGGIFALMALESANIPIPSEVIMTFSGFLVSEKVFSFWSVVMWGTLGNLAGSLISYGIAYKWREEAIKILTKTVIISRKDFESAERWFKRFGTHSAFIGRFIPVIRTFISFPAGMFRVNLLKFSILTFIGSFVWSLFLTAIGRMLGEKWDVFGKYFEQFEYAIAALIIIVVAWWIWKRYKEAKESKASSDTV